MHKYDLHIHSDMSDGTFRPEELPALAKEQGISLMALTDHDTAKGCSAAMEAGRAIGVKVTAGMEIDAQFPSELHILALDIDPDAPAIADYESKRREWRISRNEAILKKLEGMGIHVRDIMEHSRGNDTRLHIAKALVRGGYADTLNAAFEKYLYHGCPAYVPGMRIGRREAVELAAQAGGVAVLAHPAQIRADVNALAYELRGYGLWGIEAFHPSASEGQRIQYLSIASRYGLTPTAGSDFHGANRGVSLGCTWQDRRELMTAFERFYGGDLSLP